jgi:regulator of nucleoside diphosphate kinase
MNQTSKITISSHDATRLEKMLDSLDDSHFPAQDSLSYELASAEIVAPEDIPSNLVTMNSTVKFMNKSSGKESSLTLTYPQDSRNGDATVSILAPVGAALLGLAEGEQVEWPKPDGGVLVVEIIEVIYQPEREGEFLS